jgi:F420-dependent oxidoreductase-like protein
MRIGLVEGATGGSPSVMAIVDDAKRAEDEGFAIYSMANIFSHDAVGTLTLAGAQTSRIELATGIVPTYPRHPMAMAQQALTAQAASGGRFTLGIGLSHQVVIEGMLSISYDRPARHMREYLNVLMPLLRGEPVQYEGDQYTYRGQLTVPDAEPVPCLLAALAPVMLRLAGEVADGTTLWMTGAKTVEEHIAPRIQRAASNAGRPDPRIVCGLPIALTDDAGGARDAAAKQFQNYGRLPSYRAMLDIEGAAGPEDVAIVGDEAALDAALDQLEASGVTDFVGAPFTADSGAVERTRAYLADRARQRNG